jgi:hypothetical protein
MSNRCATFVDLQNVSPVTVTETCRFDSGPPRNCGPPESQVLFGRAERTVAASLGDRSAQATDDDEDGR